MSADLRVSLIVVREAMPGLRHLAAGLIALMNFGIFYDNRGVPVGRGGQRYDLLTRSAGWGRPAIASMSWLTMAVTRGRRASTRRAVNALATSLRSLVCSGGSIPLIELAADISKPG
jgi:hypothetical protein